MQSIEWDNSFSIGVQEIDDQHREWLEYFNAVANAINEGHGEEKVSNTLAFLVGYTEEHLLTEEKCMSDVGYPEMEDHKKHHQALRETLDGLVQDFREDGPTAELAAALDTFLHNWLLKHIREIDMKLGAYLT